MPGAEPTRRCSYVEQGKRCRRNGFGNPPLCRSHAAQLAAGEADLSPIADLMDVVDRKVSRSRDPTVAILAGIAAGVLGTLVAGRYRSSPRIEFEPVPLFPGFSRPAGDHRAPGATAGPGRRSPPDPPPRPREPPAPDLTVRAREILNFGPDEQLTAAAINARRRALATLYHPDRTGGDTAAMQRINAAADLLLAKVA